MEHVPATDGVPRHHGHDGFREGADLLVQVEHVEPHRAPVLLVLVARVPTDPLIATGTEGLGALTGQDDDADAPVVTGVVERLLHLVHRQRAKRVANLW